MDRVEREKTFAGPNSNVLLIGFIIAFAYSVFMVVSRATAREWFLRAHKVDDPTVWYKPNTWLTVEPGVLIFRVSGVILFIVTIVLFVTAVSQNGLSWVLQQ